MAHTLLRIPQKHRVVKTPIYRHEPVGKIPHLSETLPYPGALPVKERLEVFLDDGRKVSPACRISCVRTLEAAESMPTGNRACHVEGCPCWCSEEAIVEVAPGQFAFFCHSHHREIRLARKLPVDCAGCGKAKVCEIVPEDESGAGGILCAGCVQVRNTGGACYACCLTLKDEVARCIWCDKSSCISKCREIRHEKQPRDFTRGNKVMHRECLDEQAVFLSQEDNEDVLRLLKRRRVEVIKEDTEQAGEKDVVWCQVKRRPCDLCKGYRELQAMEVCGRCFEE